MIRPPPLSLRAKKPSKSQEIDFRGIGGDFMDRKYLAEQYQDALRQYHAAETDLVELQQSMQQSNQTLDRKSQVRIHLFQFTGKDTCLIEQEENLKRELAEVEQEVADVGRTLDTIRKRTSPLNLGNLRNELFELQLELQKQEAELELNYHHIRETHEKMAAVQISPKFATAMNLEQKLARGRKRHGRLRKVIDKNMFALELKQVPTLPDTEEVGMMRSRMREKLEIEINKERTKEKLQRRREKHYTELTQMIERIEALNKRMLYLGMKGDMVDTKVLVETYLVSKEEGSSSCEYEEEENEEGKQEKAEAKQKQRGQKNETKEKKPESRKEKKPASPKEKRPESPKEKKPASPKEKRPESPKNETKEKNPASPKNETKEKRPESPKEKKPASPKEKRPESPKNETKEKRPESPKNETKEKRPESPKEKKQESPKNETKEKRPESPKTSVTRHGNKVDDPNHPEAKSSAQEPQPPKTGSTSHKHHNKSNREHGESRKRKHSHKKEGE